MSQSEHTPVKPAFSLKHMEEAMAITPQHEDDNADHAEEELMDTFSAMKVTYHGALSKRLAESDTVEGSPVNPTRFKRLDLHATPQKLYEQPSSVFVPPPSTAPGTDNQKASNNTLDRKLLVICSASEEHNTGDHQENALRTALLCGPEGCLRRPELAGSIDWIDSDNLTPAPLTDLLRVHEYTYLKYIDEKCRASVRGSNTIGSEPLPAFYAPPGMLDSDTPLQPQSLEAAKRFCGAAILAVDHVMQGRGRRKVTAPAGTTNTTGDGYDRAFVIGRPPGHHAGPHGCVPSRYFWQRPDMASSGFCLLNTVAVAAAYARHQYGRTAWRDTTMRVNPVGGGRDGAHPGVGEGRGQRGAPRIAIVDIDIHHGNGTEEIVRNLSPRMVHLPLPSSWAPQSTLSYKPWLNEQDSDEVFFSSVHLYAAERFYPCSGPDSFPEADAAAPDASQVSEAERNDKIVNIALTPIGPGPWDRKARAKLTPVQRDALCKQASAQFRHKVSTMLLPRIARFNPDLIFISAGFDAHYDDMYHFLTEADLHWATDELCAVAARSGGEDGCGVISVLEGGYSLSSPIVSKPAKVPRTTAGGAVPVVPVPAAPVPTTEASANAADVALGRGGRQKAKKAALTGSGEGLLESPECKTQIPPVATAHPFAVAVKEEHLLSPAAPTGTGQTGGADMQTIYAQRPGDGGLVKGVLAHAAALVGRKDWAQ